MNSYRGTYFETVLDVRASILITEANIKAYKAKLKKQRALGEDTMQTIWELNVVENYLKELKDIYEQITDLVKEVAEQSNDEEFIIFENLFINGKTNKHLYENILHMSKRNYYRKRAILYRKIFSNAHKQTMDFLNTGIEVSEEEE